MAIQGGGITAYLDLETGKFDSKLQSSQGKLDGFANKMQSTGGKMTKVGGKMTKGLTLPIMGVAAAAIKLGSDFDASMSEVEAISGATGEQMAELETLARDMGATTKFSASEAADGLKYMAMAGWSTEEMAAALPGVLDLAAASGTDLGVTSDIVTDALTAFGMEASDAAGFADLLASASSNSNTNVEMLGESFKYVAPVMGAVGASADDTALALGLMANSGIKGSQAGTQLRSIMNNLIKPTDQAAATMKKHGVEIDKNADGSVNLKGTMDNLRKTLGGLDETQQAQAASTIFGKEAMSGALSIINASEEDYKKLTGATTDYNGAAKEMADIMQDNLQGSLEQMKSKLEEAGISLAESLIPMMEKGVEWIGNMVDKFNDLDEEQRENIVKWGLILAAAGPVITIFGKIVGVVGTLAGGVSALAGGIGAAGSTAGLVGSLGALGPLAVGGIAVAGIAGVAYAVSELIDDSEELEEVNVDVADSFTDQAQDLQQNISTFERLSEKANLTNEELARLNELNEAISKSSNPGEIKLLQEEYGELAKKSGLSKEEIEKLFGANKNIIEQSPDVETSISSQGDEFVISTEKAREYAQSLNDMSKAKLDLEIEKALRNEQKLLEENKTLEEQKGLIQEGHLDIKDAMLGKVENEGERIDELREKMAGLGENDRERLMYANEIQILQELEKGNIEEAQALYEEHLEVYGEELDLIDSKLEKNDEELSKLDILMQKKADVLLAEQEIYESGEKGLQQLDERMEKNKEELQTLKEKKEANGELTEEQQKQVEKLEKQNQELEQTKIKIQEETGLYAELNDMAQTKLKYADESTQAVIDEYAELAGVKVINNDILGALDSKNNKLKENKKELQESKKEEGANKKEIDKQIDSIDSKIGKQAVSKKAVLKELGLWEELDQSIKDGIDKEIKKGQEVDNTTGNLKGQGNQIDENNKKTETGIKKEEERTKEAGKDVDKHVEVSDGGTTDAINKNAESPKNKQITSLDSGGSLSKLNRDAEQRKRKPINFYEQHSTLTKLNKRAASPVSKVINFVGRGLKGIFADGTPPGGHVGGLAMVGDGGGSELITLPSGHMFLSPDTHTVLDLPRGTHVEDHRTTKSLLKNIPKYAQGTGGDNSLLRQSRINSRAIQNGRDEIISKRNADRIADAFVSALVDVGMTKPVDINMDGRKVGSGLVPIIDKGLRDLQNENDLGRGLI